MQPFKDNVQYIYSQNNEWFIIIANAQEGPYSVQELKNDKRFNPDTLVWKEGFKDWLPARLVAELQILFKDDNNSTPTNENVQRPWFSTTTDDEITLVMKHDPYYFILLVLIMLLIILYTFYQFS